MSHDNIVEFAEYRSLAQEAPANQGHGDEEATVGEAIPCLVTPNAPTTPALSALGRAVTTVAKVAILVIRMTLFFALRWIRGPIMLLLGLISGIGLLGALIVWVGFTGSGDPAQKNQLLTVFIASGVGASILRFGYDYILSALGPAPAQV